MEDKMTHKQVNRLNSQWQRAYKYDSYQDGDVFIPKLLKARSIKDNIHCGMHLLNPSLDDLSRAFCDAQKDGFPFIVIHTKRTFRRIKGE
jgi:hypothetical protein